MEMTPVANGAYRLRKPPEKATGIKVYKSDLISDCSSCHISISQEYRNGTNPHIAAAQGDRPIVNGGEYKISPYTPAIVIKGKKALNACFVKDIFYKIAEASNNESGEGNWDTCNNETTVRLPVSRNPFHLQIPNFEKH